jgi:hypothetical protein
LVFKNIAIFYARRCTQLVTTCRHVDSHLVSSPDAVPGQLVEKGVHLFRRFRQALHHRTVAERRVAAKLGKLIPGN